MKLAKKRRCIMWRLDADWDNDTWYQIRWSNIHGGVRKCHQNKSTKR
jgi:hypothetical protein